MRESVCCLWAYWIDWIVAVGLLCFCLFFSASKVALYAGELGFSLHDSIVCHHLLQNVQKVDVQSSVLWRYDGHFPHFFFSDSFGAVAGFEDLGFPFSPFLME